jgi:hypothetical protein
MNALPSPRFFEKQGHLFFIDALQPKHKKCFFLKEKGMYPYTSPFIVDKLPGFVQGDQRIMVGEGRVERRIL